MDALVVALFADVAVHLPNDLLVRNVVRDDRLVQTHGGGCEWGGVNGVVCMGAAVNGAV